MAIVQIINPDMPAARAVLTEPDENGEYGWACLGCPATEGDRGYQPMEDAIGEAETHVEGRCVVVMGPAVPEVPVGVEGHALGTRDPRGPGMSHSRVYLG